IDPAPRWTSSLTRPVVEWRSQPLEQRRLQVLLGGAIAAFASALLAIALRGSFVVLFLAMAGVFTVQLLVAAWIGSRELRAREADLRRMTIDTATERSVGRSVAATRRADHDLVGQEAVAADEDDLEDLLAGDGLGGGLFDDGFFEPIPELDQLSGNRAVDRTPATSPDDQAENDLDLDDVLDDGEIDHDAVAIDDGAEPTFTTPATPRPRPSLRPKGRPIYIEGETDEGDGTVRAVND
ncbi:MAG: hypothetical protein AAFO29_22325, partial [Actinomycetota bacterium]